MKFKFVLLVEGDTEGEAVADFLKRWLDLQPLKQRVAVRAERHSGAGTLVREMVKKAQRYLDQPQGAAIIGVIALMDLYEAPLPRLEQVGSVSERCRVRKQHFEQEVARDRFRMHFAVHEVEAWLFSEPAIMPRQVRGSLPQATRPEGIDFDNPPAKRLERAYRLKLRKKYKKPVDGANLFRKLDPDAAAAKCPYLKLLLDDMLALARQAGL